MSMFKRDNGSAKFWLVPVDLASSQNFNQREIRTIRRIVEQNQIELVRRWHEFFNR